MIALGVLRWLSQHAFSHDHAKKIVEIFRLGSRNGQPSRVHRTELRWMREPCAC